MGSKTFKEHKSTLPPISLLKKLEEIKMDYENTLKEISYTDIENIFLNYLRKNSVHCIAFRVQTPIYDDGDSSGLETSEIHVLPNKFKCNGREFDFTNREISLTGDIVDVNGKLFPFVSVEELIFDYDYENLGEESGRNELNLIENEDVLNKFFSSGYLYLIYLDDTDKLIVDSNYFYY